MTKEMKVLIVTLFAFVCSGCSRDINLELHGWKKTGETKEGMNFLSNEQFSDVSKRMLIEVEEEYKNNPSGYTASELGMLLWNCKEKNEKALALINKSLSLEPDDVQVLLNAADVFSLCDNNNEKVVDLLKRTTEIESRSRKSDSYKAEIFFGIGTIYERINEFKNAGILYSKALSLQPDDIFIKSNHTFSIKLGLNKKYRESFERVIKEK